MRLGIHPYSAVNLLFQSTHPSGVRLAVICSELQTMRISIHAPQWGATHRLLSHRSIHDISIHAPQWGATDRSTTTASCPAYFNPRTPVGCDTHALPFRGQRLLFQSTHPSGVRLSLYPCEMVSPVFQSTHPSGVRPSSFSIPL